jgi:hypothetical protein
MILALLMLYTPIIIGYKSNKKSTLTTDVSDSRNQRVGLRRKRNLGEIV